jgi:hypothetical protein
MYLVEAGNTRPETRLITISTNPIAKIPFRGAIKAHTSGSRVFKRAPLNFGSAIDLVMMLTEISFVRSGCIPARFTFVNRRFCVSAVTLGASK